MGRFTWTQKQTGENNYISTSETHKKGRLRTGSTINWDKRMYIFLHIQNLLFGDQWAASDWSVNWPAVTWCFRKLSMTFGWTNSSGINSKHINGFRLSVTSLYAKRALNVDRIDSLDWLRGKQEQSTEREIIKRLWHPETPTGHQHDTLLHSVRHHYLSPIDKIYWFDFIDSVS